MGAGRNGEPERMHGVDKMMHGVLKMDKKKETPRVNEGRKDHGVGLGMI